MRHIKTFKLFENTENNDNSISYQFISPVIADMDFREENFWNNAYSKRELENYLNSEGLMSDFIYQLEYFIGDNELGDEPFEDALTKYIEENYTNYWDFYDNEVIPKNITDITSYVRDSALLYESIKEDFNQSNLSEYFEYFELISIEMVGEDFENYKNCDCILVEVKSLRELSEGELKMVKDYLTGQYSDGWGEGFEQHERERWFIKTWNDTDFFIEEYKK